MKTKLILAIILMFSLNLFSQKKCSKELLSAVENGNLQFIKNKILNGYNINCINESKQTLLIYAIQNGKEEIAEFLINQNADIKRVDQFNMDEFFSTSFLGLTNVAKLLLAKGIDVNQRSYKEMTTLMMASNRNRIELVQFLVENGAAVNLQCDSGYTALTYTSSPKVLTYLLSKNADVNLKNFQGKDALEQSKWSLEDVKGYCTKEMIENHEKIVEILEKKKY